MFGINFLKKSAGAYALPNWARWRDDGAVVVLTEQALPLYLAELGVISDASNPDADVNLITQYWLEVAQRCIQEDLRRWAAAHGAQGLHVQFVAAPHWAFKNFHLERYSDGTNSADRGRAQFRLKYNRIRQLMESGARTLEMPQMGGGRLVHKAGFRDPAGGEMRSN